MYPKLSELVVLLIVGGIVGTLVGRIVRWQKQGFGPWTNLGIGMIGALIGGFLFRLFHIDLKLPKIEITLEDLVAAFFGSLLFLVGIWIFRVWRSFRPGHKDKPS